MTLHECTCPLTCQPWDTLYSYTLPLGTRVIYDRSTLLALSNSDLSKTPPAKMMFVAGVTKTNGDNTSLHPSAANYRKVAELKRQEEEKKKTCK